MVIGTATILNPPIIKVPVKISAGTARVTGTGVASATVRVYLNGTLVAPSVTVGIDGTWPMDIPSLLAGIGFNFTATQEDSAGVSDLSNPVVAKLLNPPVVIAPETISAGTARVAGTGVASAIIKVYVNGSVVATTTTVGVDETWTVEVASLVAGISYNFTATQEDSTGVSDLSNSVVASSSQPTLLIPITSSLATSSTSQSETQTISTTSESQTCSTSSFTASSTSKTQTSSSYTASSTSETQTSSTSSSTSQSVTSSTTSYTSSTSSITRTNTPRWPVIRWGTEAYGYNGLFGHASDSQGNSYVTGDTSATAQISPNFVTGTTSQFLVKLDSWGYGIWAVKPPTYVVRVTVSSNEEIVYCGSSSSTSVYGYAASNGTRLWTVTSTGFTYIDHASDAEEGVIVGGKVSSAGSFMVVSIKVPKVTAGTEPVIFRLRKDGTCAWVKIIEGGSASMAAVAM